MPKHNNRDGRATHTLGHRIDLAVAKKLKRVSRKYGITEREVIESGITFVCENFKLREANAK